MNRRPMARRFLDDDGWPMVTGDDLRNLFWLIALIGIILALCAVPPEWLAQ